MTLSTQAKKFIDIALAKGVLQFGDFTLKSGRRSPYFFNAGLFNDSKSLLAVGECYAAAIIASNIEYDVLFGPAYKGIPLVCATAFALTMNYGINVPFAFNRKEVKDHGEGGTIIGSPLKGRILILDDVITAGTAMRESIDIIQSYNAQVAGILIGLDRQEKGVTQLSAIQELQQTVNAPVLNVASLADLIVYSEQSVSFRQHLPALQEYRKLYGV
jgi:orotate phosphoribosyltransferase